MRSRRRHLAHPVLVIAAVLVLALITLPLIIVVGAAVRSLFR
jgi:hypothetical protein